MEHYKVLEVEELFLKEMQKRLSDIRTDLSQFDKSWNAVMLIIEMIESFGRAVNITEKNVVINQHSSFSSLNTIFETDLNFNGSKLMAVYQVAFWWIDNFENLETKIRFDVWYAIAK